MKIFKNLYKIMLALIIAINVTAIPVSAETETFTYVDPRYNNIFNVSLSLWIDDNDVAYCGISVIPYSNCTGIDGMMRLFDPNGVQLKSWAVSDYVEPFSIEKTWQCSQKGDYTLTFQGYAYGENTMYDDLVLSITTEND